MSELAQPGLESASLLGARVGTLRGAAERRLRGFIFGAREAAERSLSARDRGALDPQLFALRCHLSLEALASRIRFVEAALEVLDRRRALGLVLNGAEMGHERYAYY